MQPMQPMQPQLQYNKDARRPANCKCGSNTFLACQRFYFVPGVGNSTGQDLFIFEPALYCVACKTVYDSPDKLDVRRINA